MNDERHCERFAAMVDDLLAGRLDEIGREECRRHAAACEECAALLRMLRHLGGESDEELQARVPPQLLAGLWPRVEAELDRPGDRRSGALSGRGRPEARAEPHRPVARRGRPLLVPLLAAAVVLLLLASGLLLRQVDRLTERRDELRRAIAALDVRTPAGPPAGAPAGPAVAFPGAQALPAAPFGVTVDQLETWLAHQPDEAVLLNATQVRAAVGGSLRWRVVLHWAQAAGVRVDDGLAAGEARAVLRMLDLDPRHRLPARALGAPAGRL